MTFFFLFLFFSFLAPWFLFPEQKCYSSAGNSQIRTREVMVKTRLGLSRSSAFSLALPASMAATRRPQGDDWVRIILITRRWSRSDDVVNPLKAAGIHNGPAARRAAQWRRATRWRRSSGKAWVRLSVVPQPTRRTANCGGNRTLP